jgi:DNA repair protein RadC
MKIQDWPESERPREKLRDRGASALSEAELIAVIIGSGTRNRSAVDVAREILITYGSVERFLSADRAQCLAHPGIGPARLAKLAAALELERRQRNEVRRPGPPLQSPEAIKVFLLAQMRAERAELFGCLHLDTRNHFLAFEELVRGLPRTPGNVVSAVVRQALAYNSAAVVFVRCVQSEPLAPQSFDLQLVVQMRKALAQVDVHVLDHMLVCDNRCMSLHERRLLARGNRPKAAT